MIVAIPKIIHYCWFGGNEPDAKSKRCIESWQKKCPDYQIIRWDESNSPLDSNLYIRQALEQKKWAFVSDYVRIYALMSCGGIYLDTDVEIVRPFDDLLERSGFIGFESPKYLATCVIGGEKQHPFFCDIDKLYSELSFLNEDLSCNLTTNAQLITEYMEAQGLKRNGERQRVMEMDVFPSDWFSPKNYRTGKIRKTHNTHTIHHFRASWLTSAQKRNLMISRLLGPELTAWIKEKRSKKSGK